MTTVLITGATSGIGRQLVIDHLSAGWRVIACGRNPDALAQLQALSPGKVVAAKFDVTDQQQTETTLSQVLAETLGDGPLDRAILNAGTCEYLDVAQWDTAQFRLVMEANVMGPANCLGALLPRLDRGSELVLVDSLARLLPFTRAQAYGASKAALHYLTRTLEVDLAERGVRVMAVSPGFVDTPLTQRNTFGMPALMTVEDASAAIMDGMAAKKRNIRFPRRLYWPLTLLSWLGEGLQVRICRWLKKQE
ncbi:SDR family NAD(P)-dependent oxidoreductase [Ferrimonas balearica]|uniref:SDR family NAD(P)-dependent oxidoreductase n=1 Tax=Ferrimonas balearica TaxID=44012 RepID=UPI001F2B685A|nr:SDR family NAD(P)-dependent oxidoreductase [Ferrimonas balearica]MBY6017685.1 SDR family NAD(P)-dependent oxidoreductase [Halomonas denitrificans]MBY6094043.1 SDR family NAD(P)-dependent oxidoreductase [Ferrimonas balearica]